MAEFSDYFIGHSVPGGWTIKKFMTSGSYGNVYAVNRTDGKRGVIKIEISGYSSINHEVMVLLRLQHLYGFPKFYSSGKIQGNRMVVMQRLGRSMHSLMVSYRFSIKDVLKLGIQMVERLGDMHAQGLLHRDVHVANILTGDPREGEDGKMYLIDFGETDYVNSHTPNRVHGNLLFASTAALRVERYGRKDDLESLVYVLVHVYTRTLPWKGFQLSQVSESEYIKNCLAMRSSMSASAVCDGLPVSIMRILRDVRNMRRGDIPDYEGYIRKMRASLRSRGASENEKFSWE